MLYIEVELKPTWSKDGGTMAPSSKGDTHVLKPSDGGGRVKDGSTKVSLMNDVVHTSI